MPPLTDNQKRLLGYVLGAAAVVFTVLPYPWTKQALAVVAGLGSVFGVGMILGKSGGSK